MCKIHRYIKKYIIIFIKKKSDLYIMSTHPSMRKIIISYYNSIETIYLLLKTFFNIIQNERDTLQMINTWSTLYTYNIVLNIQKIK